MSIIMDYIRGFMFRVYDRLICCFGSATWTLPSCNMFYFDLVLSFLNIATCVCGFFKC